MEGEDSVGSRDAHYAFFQSHGIIVNTQTKNETLQQSGVKNISLPIFFTLKNQKQRNTTRLRIQYYVRATCRAAKKAVASLKIVPKIYAFPYTKPSCHDNTAAKQHSSTILPDGKVFGSSVALQPSSVLAASVSSMTENLCIYWGQSRPSTQASDGHKPIPNSRSPSSNTLRQLFAGWQSNEERSR